MTSALLAFIEFVIIRPHFHCAGFDPTTLRVGPGGRIDMNKPGSEQTDTHTSPALGVLMLDVLGTTLAAAEREVLGSPVVGGVILFARNYANPQQLRALCDDIKSCNPNLLIAVDQEGGRVQRLREAYTRLPPMHAFAKLWEQDATQACYNAKSVGWLMAAEVLSAGIDMSFAPVLDINTELSEVIGDRAFGNSPQQVSELANAFMEGMHEAGMATTGKHFPGHGSVAADSHTDLPIDTRSFAQIQAFDLAAFELSKANLDAVMPAHVIYSQVDSHCAGFSTFWLQEVLREQLQFDGVIFSDDLAMAGAAAAGTIEERVDAALQAGCDMVLVCNDPELALAAKSHLEALEQPANPRIGRMLARNRWEREMLFASDRWAQSKAVVDAMLGDNHAG